MKKLTRLIFLLIIGTALYALNIAAQETSENNESEAKKESIKKRIELLDSNDYVVVLVDNKKVRVREKPQVKEDSDLVWMFVRKRSGQYNWESINKSLVDYEKTEEYNRNMDEERRIRKAELKRIEDEKRKLKDEEQLKKGQIPDQSGQATKVFTQHDLSKKTIVTKSLYINDVINLNEVENWSINILSEGEVYDDMVFSLVKGSGDVVFTTTIKDLMVVRDEIKTQTEAYKTKVQELYDQGTSEGDKYKYSGKIVEIQVLLQDYEKKMSSIELIIGKLPKPKEPKETKTE